MTDNERETLMILARLEIMAQHGGDSHEYHALIERLKELRELMEGE